MRIPVAGVGGVISARSTPSRSCWTRWTRWTSMKRSPPRGRACRRSKDTDPPSMSVRARLGDRRFHPEVHFRVTPPTLASPSVVANQSPITGAEMNPGELSVLLVRKRIAELPRRPAGTSGRQSRHRPNGTELP
jgi:hypothetical protein